MNKTYYFKLFLFIGIGFGQEIIGSIKDKITQAPLNGVNITVENSDYGASSDKFGNYMLDVSPFEADQIVKFQHIGYEEISISIEKLDKSPHIKLKPRVLPFEAIETSGEKRKAAIEKDLPQTVSIIQAEAFELRAFVDAGDLLATDQSVQIEESLSGRKTISIRGGNANDVLVLYNGFRLNRPYDNVFDLSLVDMQNVEQIEIVKGGHSILYGPDAFSGVVNIVPKNSKDKHVGFSQQFGTYDSGFWNVNGQVQLKNTFLSLSNKKGAYKRIFEGLEIENSGLFSDLTHTTIDINNKINGNKITGNLEFNLTRDLQTFKNTRDFNTINSTNDLFGVQFNGVLGFLGEVDIAFANHGTTEIQGLNSYAGMVSRNLDHNARKMETRKYIDFNRFEWMIGVQMENSILEFWDDRNLTNVNQVGLKGATLNRDQVGVATVIKLHSKGDDDGRWLTDLDVSYRQDRVTDYKSDLVYRNDHISGTENLAFMKFGDNSWQNNIFKLSTIASKRSPGQTLAFWVTTGNNIKFPTLQQQISLTDIPVGQQRALIPEKMKSLEIGVNIVKQPKEVPNIDQIEFQGSLFRNDYSDKMRVTYLLGMPVGFYENIGHANMMGIEGKIKMKAYGGRVFGDMAFSKYDVSDLSAFPFKSTFKVTASMTAKWKYFSIGSRWFQEGEQVGMIHVPDKGFNEIELPSFSNYDIYWTLKVNIGPLKGQLAYSGRNLEKNKTSLDGLLLRDTREYYTFSTEF